MAAHKFVVLLMTAAAVVTVTTGHVGQWVGAAGAAAVILHVAKVTGRR